MLKADEINRADFSKIVTVVVVLIIIANHTTVIASTLLCPRITMDILTTQQNHLLTLTFNRPAKKNALTNDMYQILADTLRQAAADNDVCVIMLTGQENMFTAGYDLEDLQKNAVQVVAAEASSAIVQFMQALSTMPKPVIAAVNGLAVGIGVTLLLHCDLVYLADNAKLVLPFTQLGVCPEFASSLLLQRSAGYQRAAEKLLLGEPFDAAQALEMGLANKMLPATELLKYANQQAAKLVALPVEALRATKCLMKASQADLINQVMRDELKQFGSLLNGPAAQEAMVAFFEKRKAGL
jgi:enoyl-CoA hydratase/carnithine racemase